MNRPSATVVRNLRDQNLTDGEIARQTGVPRSTIITIRRAHGIPPARVSVPSLDGPFTTGQIAEMCKVAPRTVSKWFDSGRLKGYRIPGSQDRRIPRENLVRFLKEHGMPLGDMADGCRLAVGLRAEDPVPEGYERVDTFAAGRRCSAGPVAGVVIGDADGVAAAVRLALDILEYHQYADVTLVVSEDCPDPVPGWQGKVLRRPCSLAVVA